MLLITFKEVSSNNKSLREILAESIHEVISDEQLKKDSNILKIKEANEDFYIKVMKLFISNALEDYSFQEIKDWLDKHFFAKKKLPSLMGLPDIRLFS